MEDAEMDFIVIEQQMGHVSHVKQEIAKIVIFQAINVLNAF